MRNRKKTKARLLSMDELQARPCEVDGVPALFHRWIEEDRPVVKPRAGHSCVCYTDVIRETLALVEFEDGRVAKVRPEAVCFKKLED